MTRYKVVKMDNVIVIVPMSYGITPDRVVLGTNLNWKQAKNLKASVK